MAFKKWRAAWAGLRLLNDPTRIEDVFKLEEGISTPEVGERMLAVVRRDPSGVRALAEQRRIGCLELERLARYPEGSLGRAFHHHAVTNRIDPATMPVHDAPDDAAFVRAHLYETHDLWHVAIGFGTDIAGELGVQAFYAAQLSGALPPLIVVGGLGHAIAKQPDDFDARLAAVARGYTLGKSARPLFGYPWADRLTEPLGEVRASLGLPA